MKTRPATSTEIFTEYKIDSIVTFHTEYHGYKSSSVREINGEPFVKLYDRLYPLLATHCSLANGMEVVSRATIGSEKK